MLTLAFDTATTVSTCAVVRDGRPLAERTSQPARLLADVDAMLTEVGVDLPEVDRLVVGTGPGSFTGLRMGLATARALAFTLELRVSGVSTLEALAEGAPGAVPVIDARRKEIFVLTNGAPACVAPADLRLEPGAVCVGDGAVRYRGLLESAGARVPSDESELHVPRASLHVRLAREFGPAEEIAPLYVRQPDAERRAARPE